MVTKLTAFDLDFILDSLKYSKMKFESYEYPSYELKQQRIKDVETVIAKILSLRQEMKK